jgi:ribosomal-protein-alanine N-acetyltransferase
MGAGVLVSAMTEHDVRAVAAVDFSARIGEPQLRDELARPWSRIWVAREDGEPVAAFLVAWHVADELHVLNVTTRADRRRRGMGRALMDVAVAYARRQRVERLLLEVRRSNAAAIALYRSTGFFATSIRRGYYPDDEDAVEMALLLDPRTGEVVAQKDDVDLE